MRFHLGSDWELQFSNPDKVQDLRKTALRDVLHWLPVPQQTEFKIAVLAFDCVRGTGPAYFKDVCMPVLDIAARSSLRSAKRGDLFVPRT